jgi:hypothetical protein
MRAQVWESCVPSSAGPGTAAERLRQPVRRAVRRAAGPVLRLEPFGRSHLRHQCLVHVRQDEPLERNLDVAILFRALTAATLRKQVILDEIAERLGTLDEVAAIGEA